MINALGTIGYNLFQNLAILSAFLIFYFQWSNGERIDMATSVSTLAMIFYLFVTVNQLTYLAVFQIGNYFAILQRIASVLRLEEYKKTMEDDSQNAGEEPDGPGARPESAGYIKLENASFNWGFRISQSMNKHFQSLNLQEEVEDRDVLSEMNFELSSGELLIVVGSVGAGKTSLLHALMNETNKTGGS